VSLVCDCCGFSFDGGLTEKLLLILVPLVCDCWALIQDSEEFVWDIHGDTALYCKCSRSVFFFKMYLHGIVGGSLEARSYFGTLEGEILPTKFL
jgi:hypothetical protein